MDKLCILRKKIEHAREDLNEAIATSASLEEIYPYSIAVDELITEYIELEKQLKMAEVE